MKEQFRLNLKVQFYLWMRLQMENMFDICHVQIKFFVGMFWVFKVHFFHISFNRFIYIRLQSVDLLSREKKTHIFFPFEGFPFHYGHLCRALCCRLQDYFNTNPLPEPYRLNHPLIGHTKLKWKEENNRTSNSYDSLNWNIKDRTIELIEPSTGKRRYEE